jgi:hypothetical protein
MRMRGGILCLDFANTVNQRSAPPVRSYLTQFADLLYWSINKAKMISEAQYAAVITRHAGEHRIEAEVFFWEAIGLRELL